MFAMCSQQSYNKMSENKSGFKLFCLFLSNQSQNCVRLFFYSASFSRYVVKPRSGSNCSSLFFFLARLQLLPKLVWEMAAAQSEGCVSGRQFLSLGTDFQRIDRVALMLEQLFSQSELNRWLV